MFSTEEIVLLTYLTTFYWDVMWNLEKSCVNITTNSCRSLNCPPIAHSQACLVVAQVFVPHQFTPAEGDYKTALALTPNTLEHIF